MTSKKKKVITSVGMGVGMGRNLYHSIQRIQNSAARLVKRTSVRQPISPILQELHWLPVKQRIEFKILLLTFQCLSGNAPSYLQELIQMYTPARNLRSSSKSLLISPSVKTCFYGGRSFQSAAADKWNNLPESVKSVNTQYYRKIQTCSQNSFVHSLELLLCLMPWSHLCVKPPRISNVKQI